MYLKQVLDGWVQSSNSIVQVIDNSLSLRDVFAGYVKQTQDAVSLQIRNFSAARHRAHCLQKTLGRATLYIDALIATARWITINRTGVPAKNAQMWLDELSCESYLQCAMLADAEDESMVFKEFVDTEQMEVPATPEELNQFVDRLKLLWVKGEAPKFSS